MRGIPGPSTTVGESDLPPLFRASDHWAIARQSESFHAVRTQLALLLLAAACAMLAERINSRIPVAVAAVLYALSVALGLYSSRRRARVHWQVHRAAAETLKSLAWQYMVHGGPFRSEVRDPDALFVERMEERLRELRKVGWADPRDGPGAARGTGQITPAMRAVRSKPFEARRDIYLRDRMLEQLTWYRNRATQARHAAGRWAYVTAMLTALALIAAALRAMGGLSWDLTGLLSAAAAAGVAWQEVRRHRPLTHAHSLVEQDLEMLRVAMGTTVTENGWAEAVAEAERLMSPQHTDWLVGVGS
ncbi:DUF4231 domain-containing protein [Streptomyces ferrugineus]|uniref:DUF4231 domain-containing protein n=1 Tax=Streptomyces ferrugineus TaxID=1413221 RepID=A0A7M2SB55_9ACTN|nr:DUF4231 domain-containing protein [Streptomyces ferrugineus]QOV33512.1 DUF4231 domain-containing protein [Streptomyces ferrugineus]